MAKILPPPLSSPSLSVSQYFSCVSLRNANLCPCFHPLHPKVSNLIFPALPNRITKAHHIYSVIIFEGSRVLLFSLTKFCTIFTCSINFQFFKSILPSPRDVSFIQCSSVMGRSIKEEKNPRLKTRKN